MPTFLYKNLYQASFFAVSGIFEVQSYSEFALIMVNMFAEFSLVADIDVAIVVDFFTAQSEALFAIFPYHTHADLKVIVADISSVKGVSLPLILFIDNKFKSSLNMFVLVCSPLLSLRNTFGFNHV